MAKSHHRFTLLGTTGRLIWLTVTVVAFLLYGGALLSQVVSPVKTQIPAFLNLAYPILFVLLILLMVVTLLLRLRYLALGYLLLLVCSFGYIRTYFPLRWGGEEDDPAELRMVTYNVGNFELRDEEGVPGAVRLLAQSDADLICLQESLSPEQIGRFDPEGAQLLADYPHRIYRSDDRLLLLSRYEITESGPIEYKSNTNGSYWYLLRLPGDRRLLLVNNHMESYSLASEEKEVFRGYVKEPNLKQTLNRLLQVKHRLGPSLNIRARAAEAVRAQVRSLVEQFEPAFTIVSGDFNDTPMSYTYGCIRDGRRDAFVDKGCGMGISFNEPLYTFRIDHLFYEGKLKALRADIPHHKECSDHNPLIVDFDLLPDEGKSR